MEILVFSKKRKSATNGNTFYIYLTELTSKSTGEAIKGVQVRFKDGVKPLNPADTPCYIDVTKEGSNLSTTTYKRQDTGENGLRHTLWVSGYKKIDKEYVDHSLDDFD